MANGSMAVSSLPHLVLLRLSRKPNKANSLITPATASWMPFTWTLALVIVFLLVAFATLLSCLIGLLDTIGCLATNPSCRIAFFLLFDSSMWQWALLPVVFTVTAMSNYLGLQTPNISSTIIPRLSLLLLNANLRTVSSNLIGR